MSAKNYPYAWKWTMEWMNESFCTRDGSSYLSFIKFLSMIFDELWDRRITHDLCSLLLLESMNATLLLVSLMEVA